MKDIIFRCSSLGYIMPSEKARKDFTDTQIAALVKIYTEQIEGRREEISSEYLTKGHEREEDGITLLSRVQKILFKKNEVRLTNEYISGLPDLFLGENVENATEIYDIKNSWSRITFNTTRVRSLKPIYTWQMHGYMELTGAKCATVAFTLVNGTANVIMGEKKKAAWNSTYLDVSQDPAYVELCRQIEINHIFDIEHFVNENPGFDFDNNVAEWLDKKTWDIPMDKRLFLFKLERDEKAIDAIYARVKECREWINNNL